MNKLQKQYAYPLCIQLTIGESVYDPEFISLLELLQAHGFYGVELNFIDFENLPPYELKSLLERYDLRLTMAASGAYAKLHSLSLSHEKEAVRFASTEALKKMIDFASVIDAGVICGLIKGDKMGEPDICRVQMEKTIEELKTSGYLDKAPVYIEATNHYEALLANTLADAASFAVNANGPLWILPDTYHMNIEEKDIYAPLQKHQGLYHNIHLSDNNRYYPGFGSIDFPGIVRFLKTIGYEGTITIEGRNYGTISEDIKHSAHYLKTLLF